MNFKIIEETETFKPFTVEMKIETLQELHGLWLRFYLSDEEVFDCNIEHAIYTKYLPPRPYVEFQGIWYELDNIVESYK